jgi:Uncharacterized conserved protein
LAARPTAPFARRRPSWQEEPRILAVAWQRRSAAFVAIHERNAMTTTAIDQRTAVPTLDRQPRRKLRRVRRQDVLGATTVHGRFDRFDGSYENGPDGTTIELTIYADSLDTGNKTRDKHLRSTDFFHIRASARALRLDARPRGDRRDPHVAGRLEAAEMACSSSSRRVFGQSATDSRWKRPRRSTSLGSA